MNIIGHPIYKRCLILLGFVVCVILESLGQINGRCYAPTSSRMLIASYVRRDGRTSPALRRGIPGACAARDILRGRRGSPHAHDGKQRVGGDEAVEQRAGMKDLQQGEQIAE